MRAHPSKTRPKKRDVIPAVGERAAKTGFHGQDRLAASLILQLLASGDFEAVRIADPHAGKVDDFQILQSGRIDAYQVKWSTYAGSITFNDLVKKDEEGTSLLAYIWKGRERLLPRNPGKRVVVHLASNDMPSSSDARKTGPRQRGHFAAFLEEVWKPLKAKTLVVDAIPAKWKQAWDEFLRSAEVVGGDVGAFLADFQMDFNVSAGSPKLPDDQNSGDLDEQAIQELTEFLYSAGASPERLVELSRAQLIARLGWQDRFQALNKHDFSINERLYEPIVGSEAALTERLNTLIGGYLLVTGTPGSGKSTLLTKVLSRRQERTIKYYAYVPDSYDANTRGESVNFLHDLVILLGRVGITSQAGMARRSGGAEEREALARKFGEQLEELSRLWRDKGEKTVILIDGLDHIDREQHPAQSLVEVLPEPSKVGEGVLFVLGSQTDAVLPPRIRNHISGEGRHMVVGPLPAASVGRILARQEFYRPLSSAEAKVAYEHCGGHPLALAYLVNWLQDRWKEGDPTELVREVQRFTGHIEQSYAALWHSLSEKPGVRELLGTLARLRSHIDIEWVEAHFPGAALQGIAESCSHFFREEGPRWYFFHNSFRVFVVHQTGLGPLSKSFSEEVDRQYYRRIAERCAASPSHTHWNYEQLYYWCKGEDGDKVLGLVGAELWRESLVHGRSTDLVIADLRTARRLVARSKDGLAWVKFTLALSEIYHRDNALEFYRPDLLRLLLSTGRASVAIDWIRDGNRLLVGSKEALTLCRDLHALGHVVEAQRIFDLVDPWRSEHPGPLRRDREEGDRLVLWLRAAYPLLTQEHIAETVNTLKFRARSDGPSHGYREAPASELERIRRRSYLNAASAALFDHEWAEAEQFINLAGGTRANVGYQAFLVQWALTLIKAQDLGAGEEKLREAIRLVDDPVSNEVRLQIAECWARLNDRPSCQKWLQGLECPELGDGIDRSTAHLEAIFDYFRVVYYGGESRAVREVIPDAASDERQGIVYLMRAVAIIAKIRAEAWQGIRGEPAEVCRLCMDAVRFFHRDVLAPGDSFKAHQLRMYQSTMAILAVKACSAHGNEALEAVSEALDAAWTSPGRKYWSKDAIRDVVSAIARIDHRSKAARKWLMELEDNLEVGESCDGAIQQRVAQADAWLLLGESPRASNLIDRAIQNSFGVGYRKDYYLSDCLGILDALPVGAGVNSDDFFEDLARGLVGLKDTIESRACADAAVELIETAFKHNRKMIPRLFRWFYENEGMRYQEALQAVVKKGALSSGCDFDVAYASFIELIVPTITEPDMELARAIGAITAKQSQATRGALFRELLHAVDTFALAGARDRWKAGFFLGMRAAGLSVAEATTLCPDIDFAEHGGARLELSDGRSLSVEYVASHLEGPDPVGPFKAIETPESYFYWERSLRLAAEWLSQRDLEAVLQNFESDSRRFPSVCEAVSCRMVDLGCKESLWNLGEKASLMADGGTWSPQMDGGPKLSAILTLLRSGTTRALDLFYGSVATDGGPELGNLPALLPHILSPDQHRPLWEAMEEHVKLLMKGCADGIEQFDEAKEEYEPSVDATLTAVLAWHLDHPTNLLREGCQRACIRLLRIGKEGVSAAILTAFSNSEDARESALLCLHALSTDQRQAILPLQGFVEESLGSHDYVIQSLAIEIGSRCGFRVTPSPPFQAIEPWAFHAALPPLEEADEAEADWIVGEEADAARATRVELELIAQSAGLPLQNCSLRFRAIYQKLASEGHSMTGAALRSRLQSAGLELSYRNPEIAARRRALVFLCSELVAAGMLPAVPFSEIPFFLNSFDPPMFLVNPEIRPAFCARIANPDERDTHTDEWLLDGTFLDDTKVPDDGGQALMGFRSQSFLLRHARPGERRIGGLVLRMPVETGSGGAAVGLFSQQRWHARSQYLELSSLSASFAVEARDPVRPGGIRFLAVNPRIAAEMGWKPAIEGLFRWVDSAGEIMAESHYWIDGPISRSGIRGGDEVAEGWWIGMSRPAIRRLVDHYGSMDFVLRGQRSQQREGGRHVEGPQVVHRMAA